MTGVTQEEEEVEVATLHILSTQNILFPLPQNVEKPSKNKKSKTWDICQTSVDPPPPPPQNLGHLIWYFAEWFRTYT